MAVSREISLAVGRIVLWDISAGDEIGMGADRGSEDDQDRVSENEQ